MYGLDLMVEIYLLIPHILYFVYHEKRLIYLYALIYSNQNIS